MITYVVLSGTEAKYRAHIFEVIEKTGVPYGYIADTGEYPGDGFRILYAQSELTARGLRDWGLLQVGN